MASSPDDAATDRDDALTAEDVSVNWHRNRSDDQVILGVEADEVRVAVAFPADLAQAELETVLRERDRELEHYFRTLPSRRVEGN